VHSLAVHPDSLPVQQQHVEMTRIGIDELSRAGIITGEYEGHEHACIIVSAEDLINLLQNPRGVSLYFFAERPEESAGYCHEKCCGDSLSRYIADNGHQCLPVDEKIIE